MSEQLKNKCPVCHGYLFDDDDLVYCPVCGAAHHRECWMAIGKCGLEQLHSGDNKDTAPEQSDITEPDLQKNNEEAAEKAESICPKCLNKVPDDAKFCPFCGFGSQEEKVNNEDKKYENSENPFEGLPFGKMPKIIKLDPFGGIDKNEKIEGVSAEEIAKFVVFAPNKQLPKFKKLSQDKKAKIWNWAAFVSPYCHALFRKMYMPFLMYLLLEITAYVFLTPLFNAIINMNMPIDSTSLMMFSEFFSNIGKYLDTFSIVSTLLGIGIFFGTRIFAGYNNDRLYKNHVISTIKKIRANLDADDEFEFYRKGGVRPFLTFFLFMLSTYFITFIPPFLIEFLFY